MTPGSIRKYGMFSDVKLYVKALKYSKVSENKE